MSRFFGFVGALAICCGLSFTNAWADPPVPIFYNSLDSDAAIEDATFYGPGSGGAIRDPNGSTPNFDFSKHTYVATDHGFAFASNTNNAGTTRANYGRWDNNAVTKIFSTEGGWLPGTSGPGNGITVDLYFQGIAANNLDEGLWSMVRRGSVDHYFITQLKNGKLRLAFTDGVVQANQYKFTFDGSTCVTTCGGTNQEKADGVNFNLVDGVAYHLTTNVKDGVLKVWLDGGTFSNAAPIYDTSLTAADELAGFSNWTLPSAATSGPTPTLARQMSIGSRGNPPSNFDGTLQSGHWVDEVKIYNGAYTPAELIGTTPNPVPGDYNGDLVVNAADYVIWRKTYGVAGNNSGTATVSMGDGTGEGNVLLDDYTYWRTRFGNITGSGAGGGLETHGEVPEPTTAALAVCACLAFAMRRPHSPVGRQLRSK